jgi:hypothetical protein
MGVYTRAVSGQRLGKHVPAATDTNATMEMLCFYVVHDEKGIKSVGKPVRESEKGGLEPGGRGIPIVGAVTRKHLIAE